jgi:hypothetical protein
MTAARSLFAHLNSMTDSVGLFEHACLSAPRTEHGYCVDDVARGLIAVCRNGAGSPGDHPDDWGTGGSWVASPRHRSGSVDVPVDLRRLAGVYAHFLEQAQTPDGRVVNRRRTLGDLDGPAGVDDCWGRLLWAVGTAASRSRDKNLARWAVNRFEVSVGQRSPWPRAMAFAGLGAAEVLRVVPAHEAARSLLRDAAASIGPPGMRPGWPWPEPRLTYANAVLPDLLMAAGDCLHDDRLIDRGLGLLGWLLALQTRQDHLSFTPAGGLGPDEQGPGFDQQPVEAATLADACVRAHHLTGEGRWSDAVESAAAWFFGRNDVAVSLYDPQTGGCCDGLEFAGRNENQGAESTLALITTVQHASRLVGSSR